VAGPVEVARDRLSRIETLSTIDQVAAFDAVHRLLQDALATVEQEVGSEGTSAQPRPAPQHGRR